MGEGKGKNVYLPNGGAINGAINLPENEQTILESIMENPHITRPELINKTGMGKGTIDRAMKGLKEKGVIQRIGSNKT